MADAVPVDHRVRDAHRRGGPAGPDASDVDPERAARDVVGVHRRRLLLGRGLRIVHGPIFVGQLSRAHPRCRTVRKSSRPALPRSRDSCTSMRRPEPLWPQQAQCSSSLDHTRPGLLTNSARISTWRGGSTTVSLSIVTVYVAMSTVMPAADTGSVRSTVSAAARSRNSAPERAGSPT